MKLLIIESPGKAKKLRTILGDDWRVEASLGHVRDLPGEGGLHVGEPPEFKPNYQVKPDRKETVNRLRTIAAGADVYLGMDPDREGEAIAWHIADCLKLRSPKRVRFSEITEKAVRAAVAAPASLNFGLVGAQEARRVLDRMVGFKVSPALQRRTGMKVSAGRVQTPAVRLVVQREREIRGFEPQPYYVVRLHGTGGEGDWWLDLVGDGEDRDSLLLDRAVADRLAVTEGVAVHTFREKVEAENPPAPLVTSTLQQLASVKLGLSAKAAMDLAQKLYEGGHITYHRTDNPNLSEESFPLAVATATALKLKTVPSLRLFPAPAAAQAGHPAITPTRWDVRDAGEDGPQSALYRLIWERAVGCQLLAAQYRVRRIEAGASDMGERGVLFSGVRRELVELGWRALVKGDESDEDREEDDAPAAVNYLPKCVAGDWLGIARGEVVPSRTRAPKRYTDASLIRRLERDGIGRPSTYAAIMETIKSREYVTTKKRQLFATTLGELVVDQLAGAFAFADLTFTRSIEAMLDGIAAGAQSYKSVVGVLWDRLEEELYSYTADEPQCARCGAPLRRLTGVSKKSKKPYDFWKCSNRESDCPETFNSTKDGEPDFSARRLNAPSKAGAATERRA
ncbi:MAG: type IA DNA topoisomerase [Proteobacteria bacterium]|nr:type IA DNA topoisomerase [Pseudomonadota bacterium]